MSLLSLYAAVSLQTSDCIMSRVTAQPKSQLANLASKTLRCPSVQHLLCHCHVRHARQASDDAARHVVAAMCCTQLVDRIGLIGWIG